jgi:hypothetical protein
MQHSAGGSTTGLAIMCVTLVSLSFAALLLSPETRHVDINAPE